MLNGDDDKPKTNENTVKTEKDLEKEIEELMKDPIKRAEWEEEEAGKRKTNIYRLRESKIKVDPIKSNDLLIKEIPPKKVLLSPWLKEKEIAMIYAPPGTGKTLFALNCAYALANKSKFLKFDVSDGPVSVLYVDGEMDEKELQDRWRMIAKNNPHNPVDFLTPNIFPNCYVPRISTEEGQEFYTDLIANNKYKVIVFDNLSMLSDLDENRADDWNIVQQWLVQLKNNGHSIILIHHTNKNRSEHRGTSKIADNLNSVLFLQEIIDEDKNNTARFKVVYKKRRSFYGEDASEFEVFLDKYGKWNIADPAFNNRMKVIHACQLGMKPAEISKEYNISSTCVYQYINEAKIAGLLISYPYGNKKSSFPA